MIKSIQGFELKTREAIDNRLVLSKAEMLVINDNQMPDRYFAVCRDDDYLYVYNKDTPIISSETGKFRKYSYCKIESISINGVELPINNYNVNLPLTDSSTYGVSKPGIGIAAVDGVYNIDFNAIDDYTIPINKVDWQNAIIVKGYIYNNDFYVDEQHTEKYVPYEYKLYVDIPTAVIYIYNGTDYIATVTSVPIATSAIPGISKIYNTTGQNTDGSMTQKSITDGISERFKISTDVSNETIVFLN